MAFPRKLKDLSAFNDGERYLGEVASLTLPKLARKFEGWRGGGMDREVDVDMGGEKLECEMALGGPMRDILRQHGLVRIGGAFLRFAGAFQNDATGAVDQVEVTVRGRHQEIDMGEWKPGEGGEFKVKSSLVYYRLDWNGVTEIEIDVLNGVFRIGGIDQNAELRAAIL